MIMLVREVPFGKGRTKLVYTSRVTEKGLAEAILQGWKVVEERAANGRAANGRRTATGD